MSEVAVCPLCRVDPCYCDTVVDDVMTLDQAIATHPQLWDAMVEAWGRAGESSYDEGVLAGMAQALAIVGRFSFDDVLDRLRTAAP